MRAFGGKPYPFMLVAIDALTKKVAAEPLKDRLASTTAAGMKKVFQALGVPANVYSDDGAEFKREFKELMDFWNIEKQVTRGHTIRTIKEAMLRRIAAGAGRRGQWHHAGRHPSRNAFTSPLEMLGSRTWACCSVCAMLPKPVRGSS